MRTEDEYIRMLRDGAQAMRYTPSESVRRAETDLEEAARGVSAQPYSNAHAEELTGLYRKITEGNTDVYSPAGDDAYRAYREMYARMGQSGAERAEAGTRAMSGGYGDTWSGAAADQAYGEYLKRADDILPAMARNAYHERGAEEERLHAQLNAAGTEDNAAYERYRNDLRRGIAERTYAADRLDHERGADRREKNMNTNTAAAAVNMQREDRRQDRADTYAQVMKLLKKGILPDADRLKRAGISDLAALRMAKKYGWHESGSGHGGRKKRVKTASAKGAAAYDVVSGAAKRI